jgi:hypothetical protein
MKKKIFTIIGISLVLINACKKKEDEDVIKKSEPKIVINDPKKAYYEIGDTAVVNVVITDDIELHEAKCWFITRPQNDTIWSIKRHSHSKAINFNSFYVIGKLPEEQIVDFVVVAENEEGKKTTAKHTFEVHDH